MAHGSMAEKTDLKYIVNCHIIVLTLMLPDRVNSADPDQTGPKRAVLSGFTLPRIFFSNYFSLQ